MVELLKTIADLITIKEWKEYVEERKNRMEIEEVKESRPERWRQNKNRKLPSPEKPPPPSKPKTGEVEERPPAPSQGYQYGGAQSQMYQPYYVHPSTGQGYNYQFYYGNYPRPPY